MDKLQILKHMGMLKTMTETETAPVKKHSLFAKEVDWKAQLVAHVCNSSTWEVGAEGLKVQC